MAPPIRRSRNKTWPPQTGHISTHRQVAIRPAFGSPFVFINGFMVSRGATKPLPHRSFLCMDNHVVPSHWFPATGAKRGANQLPDSKMASCVPLRQSGLEDGIRNSVDTNGESLPRCHGYNLQPNFPQNCRFPSLCRLTLGWCSKGVASQSGSQL